MYVPRQYSAFLVAVALTTTVAAQTADDQSPTPTFVGEVTGNNVYVRSGPGANYYEVTKLKAGDRVTVLAEETDWYAIAPPPGCFSLVHKNFVDLDAAGTSGVVNGDDVRVRAGSMLRPDLYAKQAQLDRGATVQIIGPHNDDYLRIAPPAGTKLYISREFVARAPQGTPASASAPDSAQPATAPAFTGQPGSPQPEPIGTNVGQPATSSAKSPAPPKLEPGKFRKKIAELDAAVDAELQKSFLERNYDALIEAFTPLAEQDADPFARAYAEARIHQIRGAAENAATVGQLRIMGEAVTTERKVALQERSRIRPPTREIGGGFDAVGELRPSILFGSAVGPHWYRLVSSEGAAIRTVGYVDIPADSGIDVLQFLGRKVGVRARERRLLTGEVDPLEVYVASELVLLDVTEGTAPETPASTPADGT